MPRRTYCTLGIYVYLYPSDGVFCCEHYATILVDNQRGITARRTRTGHKYSLPRAGPHAPRRLPFDRQAQHVMCVKAEDAGHGAGSRIQNEAERSKSEGDRGQDCRYDAHTGNLPMQSMGWRQQAWREGGGLAPVRRTRGRGEAIPMFSCQLSRFVGRDRPVHWSAHSPGTKRVSIHLVYSVSSRPVITPSP